MRKGGMGRNRNKPGGRGGQGACGGDRKRDGSGPNYNIAKPRVVKK